MSGLLVAGPPHTSGPYNPGPKSRALARHFAARHLCPAAAIAVQSSPGGSKRIGGCRANVALTARQLRGSAAGAGVELGLWGDGSALGGLLASVLCPLLLES